MRNLLGGLPKMASATASAYLSDNSQGFCTSKGSSCQVGKMYLPFTSLLHRGSIIQSAGLLN